MNDDETDEGNDKGKETNNDSKEDKVDATPAEKVRKDTEELKAENDAYDKEKFRAETIRAEKAVGGKSDAGQEAIKPKEETPLEYRDRIDKEISEGKHND